MPARKADGSGSPFLVLPKELSGSLSPLRPSAGHQWPQGLFNRRASMERQQVGRERGCGGWVVGGPTSLCQSSKGGGGPAACWKGRPPRPWRGHDDHQRPCRLTDSSQSSSHLPRVRSRLLPPSLSCHCHLDTAHTCYQTVVKLELNLKLVQLETFGESLAKVLWRWRGVG